MRKRRDKSLADNDDDDGGGAALPTTGGNFETLSHTYFLYLTTHLLILLQGDLMADLTSKLHLRRRGIAGDKTQQSGGGVMDKISAMIPSPQSAAIAVSPGINSDLDDDDWDE